MSDTRTAILDLGRLFPGHVDEIASGHGPVRLRIEGHLPECPQRRAPTVGCDWCLSELSNAGVRRSADLTRDARMLIADHDRRHGDVSVAWVIAAGDVVDGATDAPERTPVVPSAAGLRERVQRILLDEILPLRRRIDVAVASGGSVELRCVRGAALLAGNALQRPEHADQLASMPTAVRAAVDAASKLLPCEARTPGLLSALESIHWDGLPTLRTQPDWRRTRRSGPTTAPAASLEALVVEAAIAETLERFTAVTSDLLTAGDPVSHGLAHRVALSTPTRALTLRMGRIDWLRTFADSRRSRCWPIDGSSILVPWAVAVALREADGMGLVSATHGDAPDVAGRGA